jgi:hypothetical protein
MRSDSVVLEQWCLMIAMLTHLPGIQLPHSTVGGGNRQLVHGRVMAARTIKAAAPGAEDSRG